MDAQTTQQMIYKELGYKSYPFPFTTPAFLEAYGTLMGLSVPPARTARVLELGSTYGGNIISQALHNPEASFTGIELSEEQVEKGNEIIQKAGLTNVSLIQSDLASIDPSLGRFDYIIAHGVYSWVDDSVKDALLKVIDTHLAENGIAYVSYNTYPGWHTLEEVRELLLFANRNQSGLDQREKVLHGKTVGSLIGSQILRYDNLKERNSKFLGALRSTMQKDDYQVGHDHLEPHNDPVYFYQFHDHLTAHHLAYVCDADLTLSMVRSYDREIANQLERLAPGDKAAQEQYLDFILDTPFRKSIICKERAAKRLCYDVADPDSVNSVKIRSLINSFHFMIQFDEEALPLFDDVNVRDTFQSILKDGGAFSMIEALALVKAANDAGHGSDEELERSVKALYLAVAEHMIRGGIRFFKTMVPPTIYMEGTSYVPARYTDFVRALVEGGREYLYAGTPFNDALGDISEEDLLFMEILSAPKTKSTVIKAIKETMLATGGGAEKNRSAMAEALYGELIKRMEQLGYLVNA